MVPVAMPGFFILASSYLCAMKISELYDIYKQYPSVQTDTRKIKKDDIFFALKGANFNGNEFAQKAIEGGASYSVIDEKENLRSPAKTILVEDVLIALQQLGKSSSQAI
jgi:UDP-N-acetylmuramoyl-tripeptide--D-alanyl-D-alanine ligase